MIDQIHGIDYHEAMKTFFEKQNIDLHKLLSVCTDGCPAMVGTNSGLISIRKKHLTKGDLLTYHCILHPDKDFKSIM
jgi:hypothetical protein